MSSATRDAILKEAEILIRTRGYAAFSYADLAERVAITKASVHYHFPAKEDLIVALLGEYLIRFETALADIKEHSAQPGQRLRAYANLFLEGFERGMLPLCGALSAERSALPEDMRPRITDFFNIHIDWLRGVLREGLAARALRPDTDPDRMAMLLLSTLEGGSFVGWALQQKEPVVAAFESALRNIEISTPEHAQRGPPVASA